MDQGLYAVVNRATRQTTLYAFPYGTVACQHALRRFSRMDLPLPSAVVPPEPIASIAQSDRPLAYCLLSRATFLLLSGSVHRIRPYFMAFSALSEVRFACIELTPEASGVQTNLTVMDETDFDRVHHSFLLLLTPNGVKH